MIGHVGFPEKAEEARILERRKSVYNKRSDWEFRLTKKPKIKENTNNKDLGLGRKLKKGGEIKTGVTYKQKDIY